MAPGPLASRAQAGRPSRLTEQPALPPTGRHNGQRTPAAPEESPEGSLQLSGGGTGQPRPAASPLGGISITVSLSQPLTVGQTRSLTERVVENAWPQVRPRASHVSRLSKLICPPKP